MKILVQGFGPFGRFQENPSELLVRALAEQAPAGCQLHTEVLQAKAAWVREAIPGLMAQHRPDAWIGVGLAAGRPALSVEAVAVNLGRWETADVANVNGAADPGLADPGAEQPGPMPWPVSPDGPDAYLTTLPAEGILAAWREAGIPGYLSHSAGTYLCNMSFYLAAQAARRLGTQCMVGFVHVPLLPAEVEQPATEPSMSLDVQQAGLRLALDVCAASTPAHGHPPRRTGGTIPTRRTG
jgi:pyroglutamyl-peptidase